MRRLFVFILAAAMLHGVVQAAVAGWKPMSFSWRAVGSYDSNRDGSSSDETGVLESYLAPRADLTGNFRRFDVDAFYSPSLRFRDNPSQYQKEEELYHDLGVDLLWRLSPRAEMTLTHLFHSTDDPAVMVSGRTFRENVTYMMNSTVINGSYEVLPGRAGMTMGLSYLAKRYDVEDFADIGDEDTYTLKVGSKYLMKSRTAIVGDASYTSSDLHSQAAYGGANRGSEVATIGAGVEKTFGQWSLRASGGIDWTTYDNATASSARAPSGDLEIKYEPAGKTTFSLLVRKRMMRADISPYASQSRTSITLRGDYEVTKALSCSISGIYADGQYETETVALDSSGNIVDGLKVDGSDRLAAVSVDAEYWFNRRIALRGGLGFEDWEADEHIRTSHERQTVSLAVLGRL